VLALILLQLSTEQKISAQIKLDIHAVVCYNNSMNANNCKTCSKPYSVNCDYRQGRCPHHPPLLEKIMEIQPKDTSRGHFYVSLAKSLIRIVAGGALLVGHIPVAGALFIVAEVLGIIEEMV